MTVASPPVPAYATALLDALADANVGIVASLPESLLKHVYAELPTDDRFTYVRVANEAELPGICVGAYLGGARAVMMMENSGIRQACEPIARFAFSHSAPFVMIVPLRGDLGEPHWWGHNHAQTMAPILDAMRIPHWTIRDPDRLSEAIDAAFTHADTSQWPVALVLSGDCVIGGQNAAS